jgi:hypothetical protein
VSAKAGLGRYPFIAGEDGEKLERYRRLWEAAFEPRESSRRERINQLMARAALRSTNLDLRNEMLRNASAPISRRARATLALLDRTSSPTRPSPADLLIVKSVHSPASAGFISRVVDATVVVIRRNPLNAVASWLELGWRPQRLAGDATQERELGELVDAAPPPENASLVEQHAWSYAALTRALDIETAHHPEWLVVQHDELCTDPQTEFARLFERLGLTMSSEVLDLLAQHDTPATGYTTKRVANEQPNRWRDRLDTEQVDVIRRIASSLAIDCSTSSIS